MQKTSLKMRSERKKNLTLALRCFYFAVVSLFIFLCATIIPSSLDARFLPQRSVLENGLVLLTSEQRALPMVTLNLLIKAGSRYDFQGKEGVANLTSQLLTHGTRRRTSLEISEALDFIGAGLSTGCSEELATVSLTILKKDLDAGLSLLAEILTAAVFSQEEIERQRQAVIAAIRAKGEEPGDIAQAKFLEALFPQSPYGRPVEGTEESVKRLERGSMTEFYEQFYRPNRSILAVVGDISHGEMMERLAKVFQSWERIAAVQEPPLPAQPGGANNIRINKNLTQANIIIGHEGVPRGHPDYYTIQVMNYILGGGGFSSRLMESIRNQRGLAYSVYSLFSGEKNVGIFQLTMQTKNESAEEAIRIAYDEIRQLREQGVGREELQAAQDYLIGSFPLRLDTNRRLADFFAQVEFFELGLDYPERYPDLIRRISQEDVHRAAKHYLQPAKLIVVVVANQEKAGLQK